MAQNDMYVVMYKIIAYLYDCMKRGEDPDIARISAGELDIPEEYRVHIIEELVDHGYVKGFGIRYADNMPVVIIDRPRVTMEGVAFAQENSMMGRAKAFLQDAKASIPFI